jgi:hypothetical protein
MKSRVDALQCVSMRFAVRKAISAQEAESISTSLMAGDVVYKAGHRRNSGRNWSREARRNRRIQDEGVRGTVTDARPSSPSSTTAGSCPTLPITDRATWSRR